MVSRQRRLPGAAALALVSGAVHAVLVPEHWEAWWGYGAFFAGAAAAEAVLGALLVLRPHPWVLGGGLVGNGFLILLYVVTRTAGIPLLGPERGHVEPVAAIDLVSKAAEAVVIALLSVALWRRPTQEAVAQGRRAEGPTGLEEPSTGSPREPTDWRRPNAAPSRSLGNDRPNPRAAHHN